MMKQVVVSLCLGALTLCSPALAEVAEGYGSDVVFLYTFAGVSPLRGEGGNGILIDYLIERDHRKGDADAAALFEELAKTTPMERFAPTLGCVYHLDNGACPRIVMIADNPLDTESGERELLKEMAARGLKRARLIVVTEQAHMGGYHFGTGLHEISLIEGDVDIDISLITWHSEAFSKASDATSRGIDIRDRSAKPRLGSHEARALWWQSGDPPRVQRLVVEGVQRVSNTLSLGFPMVSGKTYKEIKAQLKSSVRVRDLDYLKGQKCTAKRSICNARVLYADEENVVYANASQGFVFAHLAQIEELVDSE